MAARDLHALLATLLSLLEHLRKVCHYEISPNPLQLLLGDLLGEGEASQLTLPPADSPTVRTLTKMVKKQWQLLLRPPCTSWFAPSSTRKAVWSPNWQTFLSCRSLWRVEWTILVEKSWAWASFLMLSDWWFSLPQRYLRWKPLRWMPLILLCHCLFPLLCFLIIAYIFIIIIPLSWRSSWQFAEYS